MITAFFTVCALALVFLVWVCCKASGGCDDYQVVTEQQLRVMKELCER